MRIGPEAITTLLAPVGPHAHPVSTRIRVEQREATNQVRACSTHPPELSPHVMDLSSKRA